MKNSLRILFGVSALTLLLVAAPVLAAEVDVEGVNENTGFDSTNENTFDVDNDLDVDVDNDADIDNEADVDANTGHNEQNKNTKGGDLDTGDVDATGDWESVANAGWGLCGCPFGEDDGLTVMADFTNAMTGADSENKNELDVDNDLDFDIDNMADIFNELDFDANTGHNEMNKNTEGGDLDTGDASLDFLFANFVNNSQGSGNGAGPEVEVDVTALNEVTGADSKNENTVKVDNDYDLDIDNDADVDNKVNAYINTGHNEMNKNTKGGDLTTGDGSVAVAIENSVNNSGCCPKGGSLSVEADLENAMTGADSKNENKVEVDNDVDIDLDNDADINNEVDADVNTGHNEQNENTEGGSIDTGDVEIDISIFNEANSNDD